MPTHRDPSLGEASPRSEPELVRQLSAVMFADIAGYTATMQRSEAEAVAQRNRFRARLAELIAEYNGTVVQHYGDGTLSIFQSAVEATMCGLMVQRSMIVPPP